jgi:spermidine synthase
LLPRREDADGIGRVYVADTVGSIAGGILFSFVLVPWFDHFALLCFPAALNLLLAGALAWHFRQRLLLASAVIVAAGLVVHVALVDADEVTTAVQHWGQRTVYRANSPYGRLVVTEDSGQLTFFENGVPVITTHAIEQVEETVHYAMIQRPDARKVLLVSGGVTGTAREILRYPARLPRSPMSSSIRRSSRPGGAFWRKIWPTRASRSSPPTAGGSCGRPPNASTS